MMHNDHLVFLHLPKREDNPNLLTNKIIPLCSMVKGVIHFDPLYSHPFKSNKYYTIIR